MTVTLQRVLHTDQAPEHRRAAVVLEPLLCAGTLSLRLTLLLPAAGRQAVNEDSEEEDDFIYNPLKLPMGWDGKPIPYWLYKLHGLNQVRLSPRLLGSPGHLEPSAFPSLGLVGDPEHPVQTRRQQTPTWPAAGVQVRDLRGGELLGAARLRAALQGVAPPERHARPGHPQQQALLRGHQHRGCAGAVEECAGDARPLAMH